MQSSGRRNLGDNIVPSLSRAVPTGIQSQQGQQHNDLNELARQLGKCLSPNVRFRQTCAQPDSKRLNC